MSVSKTPLTEANSQKANNDQLSVDSVINWQLPLLIFLFVSCIFVAVKTVVHRHESRTAYMKLQKLEKERDKLAAQWSRLKLEQATALNQVKVERYARGDLRMQIPKASEIKIIQEPVVVAKKEVTPSKISDIATNVAGLELEVLVSEN